MLVLSRRLSETLLIGDDIKVTILGIQGNQVRLGIEAPPEVNIVRSELLLREPDHPSRTNYLRSAKRASNQ